MAQCLRTTLAGDPSSVPSTSTGWLTSTSENNSTADKHFLLPCLLSPTPSLFEIGSPIMVSVCTAGWIKICSNP